MTYLITGGAGFIGSNIAKALIKQREKVKIIDNLSTGSLKNLEPVLSKIEFIKADITNPSLLKKHFKNVDFVLHQAALSSVPLSIKYPEKTHQNNITGTFNVLLAARDCKVKRVVFASSASIYGNSKDKLNAQPCKLAGQSPYSLSKLIGEYYCELFHKLYNLETIALRYFNVYGPGQNLKSDYAAVISKFIQQFKKNKSPIIYGNGKQSRDFIYIDDVVQANLLACKTKKGIAQAFNIASGKSATINQLAQILSQIFNKKINPIYKPKRDGDIFKSQADISFAKRILRFSPKTNLKQGLKKYIECDKFRI